MNAFWQAPVFPEEARTRQARLVHLVAWRSTLAMQFVCLLPTMILLPGYWGRGLALSLMGWAATLVVHFLNRAGHVNLAGSGYVLFMWLLGTGAALTGGGVRASATGTYICIVTAAGVMLGTRAAVGASIGCVLSTLGLAGLELGGHLPVTDFAHTPLTMCFLLAFFISLVLWHQHLASHRLQLALDHAQQELRERQEAERALRESEEKFAKAFHASPNATLITRMQDGLILEANDELCRRYGVTRARAIGRTVMDLGIWGNPTERETLMNRLRRDGLIRDLEKETLLPSGQRSVSLVTMDRITLRGEECLLAVSRDITERKEAEESLRRSEQRFRAVFNSTFTLIGILAPDGTVQEANQTALNVIRAAREDVVGKPFWDTAWWNYSPQMQAEVRDMIRRAASGETCHALADHPRAEGGWLKVEFTLKPVHDSAGEVVMLIPEGHDITARAEAEEALRRNEELFRAIVEDQTEMIVRWKPDGTRTFVNEAYCRVFGKSREHYVGSSFFPLISEPDRTAVRTRIAALTPAAPVSNDVHRSIGPKGEVLWQEWTDRGIFNREGKLVELQSTGRDITVRKQAGAMTETQMQVLEMIAQGQPMTETLDLLLHLLEAQSSDLICSVLLLEEDGKRIRHVAGASLPKEYIKAIDGSTIGPRAGSCGTAAFRGEAVFVTDIATDPLWVDYRDLALPHGLRACWSTPIFDADRKVLGTFAIYHRQSGLPNEQHRCMIEMATHTAAVCIAKHRTDRALRESEQRLREIFEHTTDCVFLIRVTPEGEFTYEAFNAASERVTGFTNEVVQGRRPADFMPTELAGQLTANYRRCLAARGPIRYEQAVTFPAGNRWFDTKLIPIRNAESRIHRIAGFARDVTEQKQAECALAESEAKFSKIFHSSPDAIAVVELDSGRCLEVNEGFEQLFGYPRNEIVGRTSLELGLYRNPADRARIVDAIRREGRVRNLILQGWNRAKEELNVLYNAEQIELGGRTCILAAVQDITDRVRTEKALHKSEEKFSKAFRTSPDSISISELDTARYIEVNDGFCHYYGFAREEVVGRTSLELGIWQPEQRERYVSILRQQGSVHDYLLRTHSRDGRPLVVLISAELIQLDDRACVVAVGHDITDRLRAEAAREEALERERLSREGFTRQLIASQEAERKRIASELHDSLGQNLSIVKNRLHFARQIPGTPEPVLAHLDAVERVTVEAIAETRQLARNLRPLHIEQIGLTDSLRGLIQETSAATEIRFERRVEPLDDVLQGEAATHVYRIVQESLNNLVKHSRAAHASVTIERDVRSLRITILDDGVGFDPSQRRSTGSLGLTSLVERAHMLAGEMRLESAPGKGTRLEFEIPIPEAEAPDPPTDAPATSQNEFPP